MVDVSKNHIPMGGFRVPQEIASVVELLVIYMRLLLIIHAKK